ncbi:hypothetical protein JL722_12006 [Aureococcus anophagefferens]|nr:hypothetical protein JL722_12006 [Aureococcus anophagefferens]
MVRALVFSVLVAAGAALLGGDERAEEFVMRVNSTVGWEPRTRALLRRLLQQTTGTVFEAGAHVGDHLLPLAAAFPNLRFVGLDPDPSKVAFVERMVAANALANVRVITAALDAAPRDDCGLDRSDANAGAWRVGGNGTGACTTIDAVLASADDVGLVHLDLEGFEYRALLGATPRRRTLPDVGALIWGRPKRPCLADGVSIAKIAKSSTSVSCVLAYAGFETLLDLEALDLTTRRILRRGSFDLRLQLALGAYERNHAFRGAAIVANREDLLAARRAGLLPERLVVYYWTSLSASRTVPSCDVNYDGDDLRGITFKSRRLPWTLARREAVRDADASQSIASLAAFERERLGMIALGYVVVNLAPPADDPAAARAYRRLFHFLNRSNDTYDDSKPRAAAPADAALLVRAMGGPLATPRRLCDAAARRAKPSTLDRASLDRCMRRSAARSAFVDVEALERLVVALAWRIYLDAGVNAVYHVGRAAFGELCVSANVDNADAVWAEVVGGHLLPLSTCYVPRDALGTPSFESLAWRDPGDVRVGDVATVRIYDELIPSVLGFAVTSKARGDAVASFASTLEEHAPRPLAAGDAIEVYDKTADTWRAGALVAASIDDSVSPQLVEGGAALFGSAVSVVVQLDGTHATREWKRSFVRRPLVDALALPRAIAVLGDALREHRNVFAARLLASPLLADALAYRTSGDGNSPLDHAIQGGNGGGRPHAAGSLRKGSRQHRGVRQFSFE